MPNKIRRFFLRHLRKMRFLPSKIYVRYHYEYFSGKKLNLSNPKEFNEKIEWYKVFFRPKILNQLVDKYEVRTYVEEKIGSQYLNEIYGVFNKAEDFPFDSLPNKFVVKATHTSSHNLIVLNKDELDRDRTVKKFDKWLGKNQYYRMGQEWAYKDVQPRILVEKFLKEDNKNSLIDYKYYCFDGKAKFIDVHMDRDVDHKQGCFDMDFNLLPFGKSQTYKSISKGIDRPSNLDEMTRLSETLAENLPFVRVDFYSINGKSIFGEMTFYPSDARKEFYPRKYNTVIGDYFNLPELKNEQIITQIE
jgi:hypothetical protein